jgi:hypothetical protein
MQLKAEILLQLTPFPNWFHHSIDAEADGNCKTWLCVMKCHSVYVTVAPLQSSCRRGNEQLH